MLRELDARFFVDEPPEIEYRDNLFHITQTIGKYRFERVMRPEVYFESIAKAVEIGREHCGARRGRVVLLVPRDHDQAASVSGSPSK